MQQNAQCQNRLRERAGKMPLSETPAINFKLLKTNPPAHAGGSDKMIETERLIIRPFTLEDLPQLIEQRSDPEVNKYLGGTKMQNPEALAERIKFYIGCYEKFGFGMSAMIWKETREMFGWSGLQPLDRTTEIEVGYGMIKKFWGRGIGFEAAKAWLDFGFNVKNLIRIVAVAYPENKGSWHIMEKLGMSYEKTETHYGAECVFYGISRDEFAKLVFKS